jgi:hypothetical protein
MSENFTIDSILNAIDGFSFVDEVKSELKSEMTKNQAIIIDELKRDRYQAPERQNKWWIADYLLKLATPILKKSDIPAPVGRDLNRKFYKALGGSDNVNYETI